MGLKESVESLLGHQCVETTPEISRPIFTYETDPETIKALVLKTLAVEADDIPKEAIESLHWELKEISLSKITVDEEMIARHEQDPIHIARAESIEHALKNNVPLPPLIMMYDNHYLVDGYTPYRVFNKLGVQKTLVYQGSKVK